MLKSTGRVFEFDPAINKWSEKSRFPGVRRFITAGFVVNDQIYIFGGSANGPLTDLWQYTPATDKWVEKARFPGTSVLFPAMFNFGTKVYVWGGYFPQALVINDFWEYDVVNDRWNEIPTNEDIPARFRSVNFTIGNKGYILGGTTMGYDAFGQIEYGMTDSWEFDFYTKKWLRISDYYGQPVPYNFTSYDAKPFTFSNDNTAIIYDRGKMIRFTPE